MPTVLELYEKLKPKLGEAEARALLEFVETSVQEKAATKDHLDRTTSSLRDELHQATSSLRDDLHQTETALRKEIQDVKVDLINRIGRRAPPASTPASSPCPLLIRVHPWPGV